MSKLRPGNLHLIANDFKELLAYCTVNSIKALERSLKTLESGRAPTPTFPLYGKRDDSIVNDLIKLLEESDLQAWLIEYEKSRLSKWGQQGGIPSWQKVKEDFFLYQTANKEVTYVDDEILKVMSKEYGNLHCTKRSVVDTLAHLKRSDKIETRAAGFNTFDERKPIFMHNKKQLNSLQMENGRME